MMSQYPPPVGPNLRSHEQARGDDPRRLLQIAFAMSALRWLTRGSASADRIRPAGGSDAIRVAFAEPKPAKPVGVTDRVC